MDFLSSPTDFKTGSERIFGLRWSLHFPLRLGDTGLTIEHGTYEEAFAFLRANFSHIYQSTPQSPFLAEEYSEAKNRYYKEVGDFFLFKDGDAIVGVFTGTLVDWSSYFFRNCSILPEYQGRKMYQSLLHHLIKVLADSGVSRVEGDVSPSNLGHIHILNKMQFNITGLKISERWGSLLHFTKFLSRKHEAVFLDQFCHGIRPQVKDHL